MRKTLLIAKWEYLTTVMRGSFIFAVVAMPVLYGGMLLLGGLAGRSASTSSGARLPTALVDRAQVTDIAEAARRTAARDRGRTAQAGQIAEMAGRGSPAMSAAVGEMTAVPTLVAFADLDKALAALRARNVGAVLLLEADYVQTGRVTTYTIDNGLFTNQGDNQRRATLSDAVRAGLLKSRLDDAGFSRTFSPVDRLTRMTLNSSGEFAEAPAAGPFGPFAGPFGLFMLLTMSIFFSAGFLQQATLADRQNRMIEILLSSVTPEQLVLGKLTGLAGAGLTQIGLYLALVIVPGAVFFALFQVPVASIVISALFFVVGYLTFACLMTATGMVGRTAQESAQISALWIMMASLPWFFVVNVSAAPNGVLARALSFFPLTSAVAMMMRTASTTVAPAEVAAVLLVDATAIYLIVRGAAKLFRLSSLMYGKRFTLPELVRWLRAA